VNSTVFNHFILQLLRSRKKSY